jgi:hypothetical protein
MELNLPRVADNQQAQLTAVFTPQNSTDADGTRSDAPWRHDTAYGKVKYRCLLA